MVLCESGRLCQAELMHSFLVRLAESGNLWFAIGEGSSAWDSSANPEKDFESIYDSRTKLTVETRRVVVKPEDIVFVEADSTTGDESPAATGVITKTIRINANVNHQGVVREYGLFINANSNADSGELCLYAVHPKIQLGQLNLYMKYMYINY